MRFNSVNVSVSPQTADARVISFTTHLTRLIMRRFKGPAKRVHLISHSSGEETTLGHDRDARGIYFTLFVTGNRDERRLLIASDLFP